VYCLVAVLHAIAKNCCNNAIMPRRRLRMRRNVRKRVNRNTRYLELEKRRQELLRRLGTAASLVNDPRPRRTAMTLLNRKFRTARLGQRASILAAAEWVVRLLETGI
jgi:hypothetical protein